MIKALIVDDEPPARRELRRLLDEFDAIKVVGEAADVDVARGMLLRTRPDVVFLDIHLGRQSGFDLLDEIDGETAVVFVSAYDKYAVRAFESSAVDYLVKPVDAKRLKTSIERVCARVADGASVDNAGAPHVFAAARWVFVDTADAQEFIELASITHIEAEGGKSRVFTRDGRSRMTSRALTDWEARLAIGDFVRVHRSAMVNLKHVERVEPWSHYSFRIVVAGCKKPIVLSRRYAVRLKNGLG